MRKNGVVRTDKWLDEEFWKPEKICERLDKKPKKLYSYLLQFGMYKPNRRSWNCFQSLKKMKVWENVEKIHQKFQKEWRGPDVDIYIFPINQGNMLIHQDNNKSGVSFKNRIFLFLTPIEDTKEIEALFIHEYHHICRLDNQKKDLEEYTLLDSIVLEGLAEHAVEYYCGKEYRAEWCDYYSEKELETKWREIAGKYLNIKRDNKLHDEILFGKGRYPKLIGYALGYYITKSNFKSNNFSTKTNFHSDSGIFKNRNKIF
jgi:uncharacterized protein YjaZ